MPKVSAGLLPYRRRDDSVQVFLVHPGGPFWARKDLGAWSIPKGEYGAHDDPLAAAKREFEEETGFSASGDFTALTPVKQPGGKIIYVWAFEGDYDPSRIKSNTFRVEWPPRSGKQQEFPEVDRAAWFSLNEAKRRISKGQVGFLNELCRMLGAGAPRY
jgi:predicted NUDIX family NTP pyrophosphohydrolase